MGGTIKCFEDIKAWQNGRVVIKAIYQITSDGKFSKDFGLRDQIRRAAISINLNIAEGFGRGTDKEFRQFLINARGSVAEVRSALYIALDLSYITQPQFDDLFSSLDSLSRMITNLIRYLGDSSRKESSKATNSSPYVGN